MEFIKNETYVTQLLKQRQLKRDKQAKSQLKRNIYIRVDGWSRCLNRRESQRKESRRRKEKKGKQRMESRVLGTSACGQGQLRPSERVSPLVRHHAVHLVDGGCEGAQTYLLRLVDDLRARLDPLFRDRQVFVGVHQQVEGT